jgi:hypothetical protein
MGRLELGEQAAPLVQEREGSLFYLHPLSLSLIFIVFGTSTQVLCSENYHQKMRMHILCEPRLIHLSEASNLICGHFLVTWFSL